MAMVLFVPLACPTDLGCGTTTQIWGFSLHWPKHRIH